MSDMFHPAFADPPIDTDELCARIRFVLDEPLHDNAAHHASLATEISRIQKKKTLEALQISEQLTPLVFRAVKSAAERLKLQTIPKVFVEPKNTLNASVIIGFEAPTIFLHSSLIELLQPDELAFVIGHEFGHALYQHGKGLTETETEETVALQASRAAEVSADRVGLIACGGLDGALRAQLRLKCALSDSFLTYDRQRTIEDAAIQLDSLIRDSHSENQSHPEDAFRIWSLAKFHESDACAGLMGTTPSVSFESAESEIAERFHALADGIGFRATSEAVHESLAWLGILIVAEDSEITPNEQEVLTALVGRIWAEDAAAYARRNGLDAVRRRAMECMRPLRFGARSTVTRIETILREFGERTRTGPRTKEILTLVHEAASANHG